MFYALTHEEPTTNFQVHGSELYVGEAWHWTPPASSKSTISQHFKEYVMISSFLGVKGFIKQAHKSCRQLAVDGREYNNTMSACKNEATKSNLHDTALKFVCRQMGRLDVILRAARSWTASQSFSW